MRKCGLAVLALVLLVAGCASERGELELADLADAFPVLDDLDIESGRRIEVVRSSGSDSPGYAEPPSHRQRYVANDGYDLDDVYEEVVAALETAGLEKIGTGSDCYEAANIGGRTYTARIMRFRSRVTTPDDEHVYLSLRGSGNC